MMKRLTAVAVIALTPGILMAQGTQTGSTTAGTTSTTTKTKVTRSSRNSKAKSKTKTTRVVRESASEAQVRELREKLAEQQGQIDALRQQVTSGTQQVTGAQQSAADAQSQAAAASAAAAQAASTAAAAQSKADEASATATQVQATTASVQENLVSTQGRLEEEINEPAQLHYKGVTITPVAFFAFEGVWRQRSVNSDINTPFNSIPFPSANEGHVSELNFSGRQSRLGGLFEGNAGGFKLSGYFEADFLSSGTTSNNNQSNSYTLRQRQIWGKAETHGGFAVTGGQMWSLVTEDGKSTDARTEKLPNTIDPQYMVGYSWTRQPGLRLQQRVGDGTRAFTLAASVEQAQITNFTVASTVSAAIPTNFFFAGAGQNGGLYNAGANYSVTGGSAGILTTYANNVAPDVIVKGAIDLPKAHFELGGLGRFLRDYYYPVTGTQTTGTPAATSYTYATSYVSHTAAAGGVFGSARVSLDRFVDVAVQAMAGQGVGRYGSSQLADATLRPDETLEPIRNYHGLASLETHPTKKLDVYAYYGGEYAQRTVYTTSTGALAGALMGYGAPNLNDAGCYNLPAVGGNSGTGGSISASTCASPTRYIQEGMFGFTYRVVNSPKYGRLQYQLTYSLLQRNLWSGVGSATTPTGPRAQDSMIHAGMRYYIP